MSTKIEGFGDRAAEVYDEFVNTYESIRGQGHKGLEFSYNKRRYLRMLEDDTGPYNEGMEWGSLFVTVDFFSDDYVGMTYEGEDRFLDHPAARDSSSSYEPMVTASSLINCGRTKSLIERKKTTLGEQLRDMSGQTALSPSRISGNGPSKSARLMVPLYRTRRPQHRRARDPPKRAPNDITSSVQQ